MKELLHKLLKNTPLSASQTEDAFSQIMAGTADSAQTAALLTLLASREPDTSELLGAATVMRRHLLPINAPKNVIDTCGTGGVGSHFFNISTAAAIVAAAAGVPVCKHGNRSITSRSGSSDVLQILGINLQTTPAQEAASLATANICFAYAPTHHPAMKHVAAIRQALGFSTLFNLLGPLANPARARRQVIGTRSQTLADKLLEVLITLGADRLIVLSGNDPTHGPVCEISLTGPTHIAQYDAASQTTKRYLLSPQDLGFPIYPNSDALVIRSAQESAARIQGIFDGEPGAPRDIVLANAAAALWVGGAVETMAQGVEMARVAIDSGKAKQTLNTLIAASNTP